MAGYRPGDTMKLHIAAPVAGKVCDGGVRRWSLGGRRSTCRRRGWKLTIPVDKTRNRHDLYLSALVVRPGVNLVHATPKRAVGLLHLPLGMKTAARSGAGKPGG